MPTKLRAPLLLSAPFHAPVAQLFGSSLLRRTFSGSSGPRTPKTAEASTSAAPISPKAEAPSDHMKNVGSRSEGGAARPDAPRAEDVAGAEAAPGLVCASDGEEEGDRPLCGFTTRGIDAVRLSDGDGTAFKVRAGPNYKKTGHKSLSPPHLYHPVAIDLIKRDDILMHAAKRMTLPPPPDGKDTPNDSGLPRLLVVNMVFPLDGPSLFASSVDGPCYQMLVTFAASASDLSKWKEEGSPAVKLFQRFVDNAPEGVLPDSGDVDVYLAQPDGT